MSCETPIDMAIRRVRSERYELHHKSLWNSFLAGSRNGTFLFHRDYMGYHGDRFVDHSVLFFEGDSIVGLMAANEQEGVLVSHGGLTYGGLITDARMKTSPVLTLFHELKEYMGRAGLHTLRYKAVPHIYHQAPCEEDLYAIFRCGGGLVRRDMSSCILPSSPLMRDGRRRRCLKKAESSGLQIRRSTDFRGAMGLAEDVLGKRHGKRPVHSADEMALLASSFPDNIKLFGAYRGQAMVAGVIVYESPKVAHVQYSVSNEEGRKFFALDLLFDFLVRREYAGKAWFDFGISTESEGRVLNEGLIAYKEEFGARGVAYDTYEMSIR